MLRRTFSGWSDPVVWLICGTTLIRLAFAATTGLGVDESYMVTAGRVLSLGYFDHPPASWWLSWAAAHCFGTEIPIVVRLPFILLFAVSQFFVWRIACLLPVHVPDDRNPLKSAKVDDNQAGLDKPVANRSSGLWAVVAFNLSPVFTVTTGSWVLPDGPLDTALLGAALSLLHALPANGRRASGWWALSGLCAGLAMFSKYSAALTISGAVLYLVTSPVHRRWLVRPQPYLAAALALLIFSPVLIWNAEHHWASIAFQGDRAVGLHFRPLMALQTLGGEALFVLPWLWVPMMILLVSGFQRNATPIHRFLVWLAVPPIVGFAMISTWSSQRVLFHWAAPGYLMLFPLLGNLIASRIDRMWMRTLLAGSSTLILVTVVIIVLQLQTGWLSPVLITVLNKDPTAEGLDWTSVYNDLRARGQLPVGTVVASMNWRDAGKVGYALGPDVTMLCLNPDSRQFGFADPLRDYAGHDVLVVVVNDTGKAIAEARGWFKSVDALQPTSIRLDGYELRVVTVLRGRHLNRYP